MADISFVKLARVKNKSWVVFRIDKAYWAYRIDMWLAATKIRAQSDFSHGKALATAKKISSDEMKVHGLWPVPSEEQTIISQEPAMSLYNMES